ncbi:cryptochrome/photolyase family protein [Limibacillus halophilus]
MQPSIVWFRQDLRLADNPALAAAKERGAPILPLFILDDETAGEWAWGGAGRWWLHHSLDALSGALREKGAPLLLLKGKAEDLLPKLVEELDAGALYWNRCYEPFAVRRDKALKAAFAERGLDAQSFAANLLVEPWKVKTGQGEPYKVFTPFWRALQEVYQDNAPLPAPDKLPGLTNAPAGERLEDWRLLPTDPDWAGGLRSSWTPGEAGAKARLEAFFEEGLADYKEGRNRPDKPFVSRLSPHLHWGEISPRQIWRATLLAAESSGDKRMTSSAWSFLREVGWRDFSHNLLFHWPDLPEKNWKENFDGFPWADDEEGYRAWTKGRTGYPIVDAGMRELWTTGYMHNRVRMIAASFLIKDLLVHWRRGEAWFWDTLVDADLANNSASWQWVAGSGADAAPYFRIFNPISQGEKFDPKGAYVRHWVPEIAALPDTYLHKPWEAPDEILQEAGLKLGRDYPHPIVDHAKARRAALDAYERIKKS